MTNVSAQQLQNDKLNAFFEQNKKDDEKRRKQEEYNTRIKVSDELKMTESKYKKLCIILVIERRRRSQTYS